MKDCHPCERAVSKASSAAMLTKGCGEDNNDERRGRIDEAPSNVSGTDRSQSHSGYCYMEALSKRV